MGGRPVRWRESLPRGWLHWASCLVLWGVFLAYLGTWARGYERFLADLAWQNDDARGFLAPLHRYEPGGGPTYDPVGDDLLLFMPPALRWVYGVLVPRVGLFPAAKIVQGICVGMILVAGGLLIRNRRAGLAAGVLLVFLLLRSPYVVDRMGGGLPRGFGFPVLALWAAGAVIRSERVRFAALLLGAAVYPSALLLGLVAEGLLAVGQRRWQPSRTWTGRLVRCGVVVLLCGLILWPYTATRRERLGRAPTLAEAEADPTFGPGGRIPILPLRDPVAMVAQYFLEPIQTAGKTPSEALAAPAGRLGTTLALIVLAGMLLLIGLRWSPLEPSVPVFCATALLLYFAARVLAFRLYEPERFLTFGLPVGMALLGATAIGLVGRSLRSAAARGAVRNIAALVVIAGLWLLAGDGVGTGGMAITSEPAGGLHAFVRSLPPDTRVAVHPLDREGMNLALWSGRATTEHAETYCPWVVEHGHVQAERQKDTLRMLYARRREDVLDYCTRERITHILLDRGHYTAEMPNPDLYEPLTSFLAEWLRDVRAEELVLWDVPAEAVAYELGPLVLVDLSRLRQSWGMP